MENIREQVETFTLGVSKKMLTHQEYFHLNRDEEENTRDQNDPTLEGGGNPLVIPHSTYFSKNVLDITGMHPR